MKLLIVEDDVNTRKIIKKSLEEERYYIFETGAPVEALKHLKGDSFDFILLDIGLPDIDGYTFCQIVRKYPEKYGNPYIMMLTSKKEEDDVVKGLEFGADDYLKKPFGSKELLARIRAIAKRFDRGAGNFYRYSNLKLDEETLQCIDLDTNEGITLYRREFDMLIYFVKNEGLVLTREKIYEDVWGDELSEGNRTVDNYISKLKMKIKILDENLVSIRGMGYKLNKAKDQSK